MPRSSSQRITPLAASRPKALPPARTIACTLSIALTGSSSSVSRVPGEAPRTSTPATAPSRAITTVQPVGRRGSVKWPTSRPATAVKPRSHAPACPSATGLRPGGGQRVGLQANTPAVVCMRRDTSPIWNSVSPKVISITVRRLK